MIGFLTDLGLFPEQASTMATRVDALYYFLLAVSAFFSLLIATLIVVFSIRYRRRAGEDYEPRLGDPIHGSTILEITWSAIPFAISMVIFGWGASVFFAMAKPPDDALEVFVVGKQWMWKLQHMEGRREINELHVPVGTPIKLTMTSEDVIHSFFVPAFRVKADVLPGRYTTVWFEATKEGRFHLFCTEYCGTQHSRMIGSIVVQSPDEHQKWLLGGTAAVRASGDEGLTLAALGARVFERNGCQTCHTVDPGQPAPLAAGPPLHGVFGQAVPLESGITIVADGDYLRRSIIDPMADIVRGYRPMMPTYKGRLSEEEVMWLVAYIKSLAADVRQQSAAADTES